MAHNHGDMVSTPSTPMDMGGSSTMDMHGTTMDMGGGGHKMHMGMKMYFHVGVEERVLFDFWNTTDAGSMLYSCVIIFILAFLYEGIKYFRDTLYQHQTRDESQNGRTSNASTVELDKHIDKQSGHSWSSSVLNPWHLLQTCLHALQFFVSYLLMLIFMTYNVWLCLSVILGAAFGFFLFGWRKQSAVEITEHCQ